MVVLLRDDLLFIGLQFTDTLLLDIYDLFVLLWSHESAEPAAFCSSSSFLQL